MARIQSNICQAHQVGVDGEKDRAGLRQPPEALAFGAQVLGFSVDTRRGFGPRVEEVRTGVEVVVHPPEGLVRADGIKQALHAFGDIRIIARYGRMDRGHRLCEFLGKGP